MVLNSQDIPEAIRECGSLLLQAGLIIDDWLGSGEDGVVYRSSPGCVIKFSISSHEAQIAAYLMKHWHPGLPKIHGVWDLSQLCKLKPPFYAILREDLYSINTWAVQSRISTKLVSRLTNLLYSASSAARERSQLEFLGNLQRFRSNMLADKPTRFEIKQWNRIARLALWMRKAQLYASDIGGANWGQRADGSVVVRDFSQFSFASKKRPIAIPFLL